MNDPYVESSLSQLQSVMDSLTGLIGESLTDSLQEELALHRAPSAEKTRVSLAPSRSSRLQSTLTGFARKNRGNLNDREETILKEVLTSEANMLSEVKGRLKFLQDRVHRLQASLEDRDARLVKLEQDEAVVEGLQREMAPSRVVAPAGYRIHQYGESVDRISGDVWDIRETKEGSFCFSLADIAGHGAPAGQLSILVRSALNRGIRNERNPVRPLLRLNRDLYELELEEQALVAALCGHFEPGTGRIRWARCGASYPILVSPGEAPVPLKSRGTILGCLQRPESRVVEHELQPGETILFATDGIENLTSPACPPDFQKSGWYQALGQRPIEESMEDLADRASRAKRNGLLKDDLTVLVFERSTQP